MVVIDRPTKLRWRRRWRQKRRQVEGIGVTAEEHLEKNFFKRLSRLVEVRRFVFAWLILFILLGALVVSQIRALGSHYLATKPVPGGTFTEGIIGTFTNANPLYATNSVDTSVASLVFAGLLKTNDKNELVGNLAESWSMDETGFNFEVVLRPGLTWHDGTPLTAHDVLFTYQTIQNPDARSPLYRSWQGVVVEVKDDRTVKFTLPNALGAFPYALTNGIVPKHLLANIPVAQLRSARFNTVSPVGAGPFRWETIEVVGGTPEDREERIGLLPFEKYHGGTPALQHYIVRTFHDEQQMTQSYSRGELQAMAGLNTVPDTLAEDQTIYEYNVPLNGEVLLFFRNTAPLLAETKMRQALSYSLDRSAIIQKLPYPVVAAHGPLLADHVGFDKAIPQISTNHEEADKLFTELGWLRGADGMRMKDGKPLQLFLFSQDTSEFVTVTKQIQEQLREAGIDVQVTLQSAAEIQITINANPRNYDMLVYGISLGADPDVFPFWHSSQANASLTTRLNLSEYKSTAADQALEAGRTRTDASLRAIKYQPFLQAWRTDAPAVALYQPRFLYVSRGTIHGFQPIIFNAATDRYANVHQWMIREARLPKE